MVQMNWSAGQKLRHRYREKTYGHQEGKVVGGVGGGMNWEIGINMYILICIKWITIRTCWASLVAQWLSLPANAGDTGSSPGLGGSRMPRSG